MKGKIALGLLVLAVSGLLGSLWHGGVQAQTTTHGVALTCTAATGDATFNFYRSTTSGGPYTSIATGQTTCSFKDTTGIAGTKYFYVVTGNAPGFLESVNSNEVSATFLQQAAAPTGLAAVAN